jgi:3-isopropylmalate dehydrogenase
MILSAAMMLDYLGETRNDATATDAGKRIEAAVARVLAEGKTLTPDLGGTAGTRAVGEAVVRAMGEVA